MKADIWPLPVPETFPAGKSNPVATLEDARTLLSLSSPSLSIHELHFIIVCAEAGEKKSPLV